MQEPLYSESSITRKSSSRDDAANVSTFPPAVLSHHGDSSSIATTSYPLRLFFRRGRARDCRLELHSRCCFASAGANDTDILKRVSILHQFEGCLMNSDKSPFRSRALNTGQGNVRLPPLPSSILN